MEFDISTRHGALSSETQQRIREKVAKLPRYLDRITAVHVTVDVADAAANEVEVRVSAEHAPDFVAREKAGSVSTALDGALHKLEQQLRKHKQKKTEHRATGLKDVDVEISSAAPDSESLEPESEG